MRIVFFVLFIMFSLDSYSEDNLDIENLQWKDVENLDYDYIQNNLKLKLKVEELRKKEIERKNSFLILKIKNEIPENKKTYDLLREQDKTMPIIFEKEIVIFESLFNDRIYLSYDRIKSHKKIDDLVFYFQCEDVFTNDFKENKNIEDIDVFYFCQEITSISNNVLYCFINSYHNIYDGEKSTLYSLMEKAYENNGSDIFYTYGIKNYEHFSKTYLDNNYSFNIDDFVVNFLPSNKNVNDFVNYVVYNGCMAFYNN